MDKDDFFFELSESQDKSIFDFGNILGIAIHDHQLSAPEIARVIALFIESEVSIPINNSIVQNAKDWGYIMTGFDNYEAKPEEIAILRDLIEKYAGQSVKAKFTDELNEYAEQAFMYNSENFKVDQVNLVDGTGIFILEFYFDFEKYIAITNRRKVIVLDENGKTTDEFDSDVILSKLDAPKVVISPAETMKFGAYVYDMIINDINDLDIPDT